jgi:hypothetical protein
MGKRGCLRKDIPCSGSELGYLHSFGDWDSGMQDVSEVHSPKQVLGIQPDVLSVMILAMKALFGRN